MGEPGGGAEQGLWARTLFGGTVGGRRECWSAHSFMWDTVHQSHIMVRVLRESVWNLGHRKSRSWQSSMRLPTPSASATRRAVLAALTSTALLPLQAPADSAIPTYSLKGVPGLSSITGADAPRPSELGVLGKGQKGDKTGRLQFCEKKGCISSFSPPDQDSYVPPWTYDADFQTGAISPNDARRAALKAAALAEKAEKDGQEAAASTAAPAPAPSASAEKKSIDSARAELVAAIEAADGRIVQAEDRYVYSEFTDPLTGVIDDVEFLFSRDTPLVGYRSAPRGGGDDKRQRNRIRDLRKSLKSQGWKSVGRLQVE